jgi:hypothetical protein
MPLSLPQPQTKSKKARKRHFCFSDRDSYSALSERKRGITWLTNQTLENDFYYILIDSTPEEGFELILLFFF